ncbi:uncharacterized protein LOC143351837 [Colletes latitarsis]|uniref:uncharacterized protein LOC143351837 n=1 Tax=Colletes latitarsis TaxID=2605962 RepID=UPI004036AD85
MNLLFFLFLSATVCYHRLYCNAATMTEYLKMDRKSIETSILKNDDNQTQKEQVSWKDLLLPRQEPLKIEDLEKIANTKGVSSNRKSKILGSLAFLTGLSVGSLSGASSNVNTYAKAPPVNLNFGASRIPPHLAAIYNPYPYVPHPYIFATHFGLYPLLNPLGLQTIDGVQNDFQTLAQNQQALNLLENKNPIDLLNNNDEYIEEAKKVENVRTSNDVVKKTDESAELQVEDDRNAEEKNPGVMCDLQKKLKKKESNLKSVLREPENTDGSSLSPDFRASNRTVINATDINNMNPGNKTDTSTTMNSTMINNGTSNPPFYGYYGGYPQNIEHIDFTTETSEYHDYGHINYNLPSYDKPVNFYSNERYNYYSNPPVDSSSTNDFHQEQIPEYYSNDFNRFLYTPYNTPSFANNGFRPVA